MRVEIKRYFTLVAETDEERESLQALSDRVDEVRIECRNSLFREHEVTVYIPVKQHPESLKNSAAKVHIPRKLGKQQGEE